MTAAFINVSTTFQHTQKSTGTTMVVMICSQLEQCSGKAKIKAETLKCSWLKNTVKTFLTRAILRGTVRKEYHPLKERLDQLSKTMENVQEIWKQTVF